MIKTCYLHIGCEKTGSTTLQTFMGTNRAALANRGVLFPQSPGGNRHSVLYEAALQNHRLGRRRGKRNKEAPESIEDFRAGVIAGILKEAEVIKPHGMILTEETMAANLKPPEIARLKSMLAPFCERFVIVCYLRRQDELVISKYNTGVMGGRKEPFAFPEFAPGFDFAERLGRWRDVFGAEAMRPRRFGEAYFTNGDLFDDLGEAFDLDMTGLDRTQNRNVSLDLKRLEFMRLVNLASGPKDELLRRRWASRLQETAGGVKLGASRADRLEFLKLYDASNRQVAKEYFGLDGDLFTHPVRDDAPKPNDGLTLDAAAEIAFKAFKIHEAKLAARQQAAREAQIKKA